MGLPLLALFAINVFLSLLRMLGIRLTEPWERNVASLAAYAVIAAFLCWPGRTASLDVRRWFRPGWRRAEPGYAAVAGIGLVALSFASVYLMVIPLAHFAPDLLQSMIDDSVRSTEITSLRTALLPSSLTAIVVSVCLGPFIEELFFRGVLVGAILRTGGRRPAILWSSLAFAVFHVDVIGALVFGIVAAVIYLATGSLWSPVITHVVHNGLVRVIELVVVSWPGTSMQSVAVLQATWWLGVLGFLIGVPLVVFAVRRLRARAPILSA